MTESETGIGDEKLRRGLELEHLSIADAQRQVGSPLSETDFRLRFLAVPVWQLGGANCEASAEAARLFFDAGVSFRKAGLLGQAMLSFRLSIQSAGACKGDSFRMLERDAAWKVAEIYLTMLEASTSPDDVRTFNLRAAQYSEIAGFTEFTYGSERQIAVDYYRTAIFRYWNASAYKHLVSGTEILIRLEQELANYERLAQAKAYRTVAELLGKDGSANWASSQISAYLALQDDWELGRLQSNFGDLQKRAEIAVRVVAASTRGLQDDFWRYTDAAVVFESLTQSLETFQNAGESKSADEVLFLKGKWRQRKLAARRYGRFHPVYWLMVLSEVVWGFGARPLRLLPVCAAIMLLFAVIYFAGSRIALPHATSFAHQARQSLLISMRYFVPDKLFEGAGLSNVPAPQILGSLSLRLAARIESLLGLGVVALVGASLVRWMKRFLTTVGEKD